MSFTYNDNSPKTVLPEKTKTRVNVLNELIGYLDSISINSKILIERYKIMKQKSKEKNEFIRNREQKMISSLNRTKCLIHELNYRINL